MRLPLAFFVLLLGSTLILPAQTLSFVKGSSSPGGNCACLPTSTSRSAVWADDNLLRADFEDPTGTPITWEFELYFGEFDAGGQGIAFLIQQDGNNVIGGSNANLGYGGKGGVRPAVVVEMDTRFQSWHDPAGAVGDHMVAYFTDELGGQFVRTQASAPVNLPDIEDNNYHSLEVTWTYNPTDPSNSTLLTVLDNNYSLSINLDPSAFFNATDPIYYGFTSASGINYLNLHKVSFSALFDPLSCSNVFSSFPVEYLGLSAEKKNDFVQLDWQTASELNNDYFQVERSHDLEAWTVLGRVDGAGTTDKISAYSFKDHSALAGKNYYRLRQVDLDGGIEFSNMLEVNMEFSQGKHLSVYPSPVSDRLQVVLRSPEENKVNYLRITNTFGQVLMNEVSPNWLDLRNEYALDVASLTAGVYILEVKTQKQSYTQKFVVR